MLTVSGTNAAWKDVSAGTGSKLYYYYGAGSIRTFLPLSTEIIVANVSIDIHSGQNLKKFLPAVHLKACFAQKKPACVFPKMRAFLSSDPVFERALPKARSPFDTHQKSVRMIVKHVQ